MSDEREVLTWSDFGVASRDLAAEIAESGFRTDIVIAVARGGLVPAGALAYAFGTKAAGTLNVEFYTDVEETLPAPVVLEPMLDTPRWPARTCSWWTTSPTAAGHSPW